MVDNSIQLSIAILKVLHHFVTSIIDVLQSGQQLVTTHPTMPITNELLCFLQNRLETPRIEMLTTICTEHFSESEVTVARSSCLIMLSLRDLLPAGLVMPKESMLCQRY